jgi:hypothetical protein
MAGKADTQINTKLYICATAQTGLPLNQAAFEALTWVQIKKVGSVTDVGGDTNPVSYPVLDEPTQKGKGEQNGGDWTVEYARVFDDAGQVALRAAAKVDADYAFKLVYDDKPSSSYATGTTIYNCGRVYGPRRPGGRKEEFIREEVTLGMNQEEVVVEPQLA